MRILHEEMVMARVIHARRVGTETRFRLWSTITDSYVSEELNEEGLRAWLLQEATCEAIRDCLREMPNRIKRASESGTSSMMDDARDVNGPWDPEAEDSEGGG